MIMQILLEKVGKDYYSFTFWVNRTITWNTLDNIYIYIDILLFLLYLSKLSIG